MSTASQLQNDAFNGLTSAEVLESRKKHGSNMISPPKRDPEWKKFLEKFDDQTIKILLAAAVISMIMALISKFILHGEGGFVDSLGILVAVTLATTVAYFNEKKSDREFELLNQEKEAITVKVTRDGKFQTIPIAEIVVGDVVHLDSGDKICSDGTVLSSLNLTVDESLLTGETMPARKSASETRPEGAEGTAYPPNRVFRGTMVVDGHGRYLTTAVGDMTEMGRIAKELGEEEEQTPLKQKLTVLADQIGITGTVAAAAIFSVMGLLAIWRSELIRELVNLTLPFLVILFASIAVAIPLALSIIPRMFEDIRSKSYHFVAVLLGGIPIAIAAFSLFAAGWGYFHAAALSHALLNALLLSFVIAVTVVVVAVPEGLPMMVNVSLALNMRKMSRENCLVRKLVASETLGSTTVICTDKTGTLTQNRMKPVWFYLDMKSYSGSEISEAAKSSEWDRIVRNIAINSEANLEQRSDGIHKVGNPTEAALLMLLHEHGIDYRGLRDINPAVWQVDYNSERKMSIAMIYQNGGHTCYAKGAPERILANCSHIRVNNQTMPMDGAHREQIQAALQEAAGEHALRVIAFSEKLESDEACTNQETQHCLGCHQRVFVGLVGIADPLREGVSRSVAKCRRAGVEVKMITGDDPRTARSIARQCGILEQDDDLLMTSTEFQQIKDNELPEIAKRIRVLARSNPFDKLRLVQALQGKHSVVAVTGDGTNDAPALKAAEVGLSMGSGTEVAKEASDIVLVDDNFASIVTGIRWGRTLYENIQRFLQFQLSVNVVALLSALIGPMVGVPLPLTVPQLLWINIIMDTFAALALSTDPPRPRYMEQPPVQREKHIITKSMVVTIGISSLYQVAVLIFVLLTNIFGGKTELEKLTIFFTVFVMFQFWHKFNCRSLRHNESPFQNLIQNKNFIFIVLTITAVQILMVQVGGPIGELFRTMPLSLPTWLWILLLTATVLPVAWLARQIAFWMGAEPATASVER
ncbi:MAG TPA: calcium-translocating P-type ATPase, PMCA-type [Acidobacteriota bacterium]|jgi:Ca2+-transporting ATPase|nr:calcium-translocating P-type ATPase, PMCA-type [Acidobacteriota bacterium]